MADIADQKDGPDDESDNEESRQQAQIARGVPLLCRIGRGGLVCGRRRRCCCLCCGCALQLGDLLSHLFQRRAVVLGCRRSRGCRWRGSHNGCWKCRRRRGRGGGLQCRQATIRKECNRSQKGEKREREEMVSERSISIGEALANMTHCT